MQKVVGSNPISRFRIPEPFPAILTHGSTAGNRSTRNLRAASTAHDVATTCARVVSLMSLEAMRSSRHVKMNS